MVKEADNPYEPPTASSPKTAPPRLMALFDINWMRAIFSLHVFAIIAGAFVVGSETILANRLLQLLIAIPLIFTIVVFPILMLVAAIVSSRQTAIVRTLAVVGDFALSAIQLFVWLPTVQ